MKQISHDLATSKELKTPAESSSRAETPTLLLFRGASDQDQRVEACKLDSTLLTPLQR